MSTDQPSQEQGTGPARPAKFGRYQVKAIIGQGAMGTIYLAEDPVIGRQVAIKVIQVQAGTSQAEIENLKMRFEREFRSAGTLSHPNIVTVHDVGTEGDAPFIAMEYVQGSTLEQLINERHVLSFEEIADLTTQICDALDFAHLNGVVHRDVKPANILLDRARRPKITDFGVARLSESALTHSGGMVGTPWYMSPEQVVGEPATGAADQFSVAVMAYQMLTGERPFSGERSSTVLYKIVHEEPVRPHLLNPRLMPALDDVLLRAFQKNPQLRYPTCVAFARDLQEALGVVAAKTGTATLAGAQGFDPDSPTLSMTLDANVMKEWQTAARSGARSAAGSGAGSQAGSRAGSRAASAARPPSDSGARSGATSAPGIPGAAMAAAAEPAPAVQPPVAAAKPPRAPAAGTQKRGTPWLAIVAAVVVLGGALGFFALRGGGGESEVADATAIEGVDPLGDDAIDPATGGPIAGASSTGEDVVSSSATDAVAPPVDAAALPASFRIVTKPPGAKVIVDGTAIEQVTPADVPLSGRSSIRLEMEGFNPVGWTFAADRLTPEQRRTGTLYFPLQATKPQTTQAARAPAAPAAPVPPPQEETAPIDLPTSPPGSVNESLPTVRAGADVPMPKKLVSAEPRFAASSVPSGREPIVILELTLDPLGEVAAAKVLRGLTPELDRAALQTVYQWRYEPSRRKNKPVNVILTTTVMFQ
jgi:serine/threonine-protein kinase